jgi:RNA polymerase sigma-70 factor (ECF subfamily)
MHPPISRADLAAILGEADAAAARLWRRLRLPRTDLDDLRQDLLVDPAADRVRAGGSNSRARSSTLRPARASATIWARNSGG